LVLFFERLPLPLAGESVEAVFFLMVQATQIMHLYGRRDHFMSSKIRSEEWIDC
jgi:hypothetical protein